jgi:5-methylcytosine-specific restriction endonuclease McrA
LKALNSKTDLNLMSLRKKQIRDAFRESCFTRDKHSCALCGFQSTPEKATGELDAHHISPREQMPNGGYVADNGISLCSDCHIEAEDAIDSLDMRERLYIIIGSSHQQAVSSSYQLGE